MKFELLRTRDRLVALRDAWNGLWARGAGDYFTGFESCLISWDTTHEPRGSTLCCAVALEDDGTLVGVLPMTMRRKRLWMVATTVGPDAAEGCDVLVAADAPPHHARDLVRFFLMASGADILDLPFVRTGNALDLALKATGAFSHVAQTDTMPYARLRGEKDWETFERSLSRHTQREVGRKRRQFEKMGTMSVKQIEGAADAELDWLLDEKADWGRKVGKVGTWLFSPNYRTFLKRYAASSGGPSGERVLTFVLTFEGDIAAVKVLTIGPTLCTLIIAAYDRRLSKWSPGNILDEVWMRYVFDHARDAAGRRLDVNFGTGTEHYKLHWSRDFAYDTASYKVAATTWGSLPYRAKAAIRLLRQSRSPARTNACPDPAAEPAG